MSINNLTQEEIYTICKNTFVDRTYFICGYGRKPFSFINGKVGMDCSKNEYERCEYTPRNCFMNQYCKECKNKEVKE